MTNYPTAWQEKTMWTALATLSVGFVIAVFAVVIWVGANIIGFLQPILIPVAIAIILAYLLDPLVTRLAKGKLGRTPAILIIFLTAFLCLAGLVWWVVPMISFQSANFAKELPRYTQRARDRAVDFIYRYDQTFGVLGGSHSKSTSTSLANWLLGTASPTPRPQATSAPTPTPTVTETPAPVEMIGPPSSKPTVAERQRLQIYIEKKLADFERKLPAWSDKIWNLIQKSIGGFLGVAGFILSLVMVPIYLFFFLKERPRIEKRWKEYLPLRPSPFKDEVAETLSQINSYIIAYFRGQLLVCLVDGTLIGSVLTLYGLNFAPLIGLLVVILTMIPYVGIVVCWVPAVLIATFQWGDFWHPFWVTVIFVLIQNLEGTFYAPRIVGSSVGLHPMTVIVSIFVWGLLIGGLLGPILAVPLTATIKVLLSRYVWGQRLRDKVEHQLESVPVVRESHG